MNAAPVNADSNIPDSTFFRKLEATVRVPLLSKRQVNSEKHETYMDVPLQPQVDRGYLDHTARSAAAELGLMLFKEGVFNFERVGMGPDMDSSYEVRHVKYRLSCPVMEDPYEIEKKFRDAQERIKDLKSKVRSLEDKLDSINDNPHDV